MRDIVLGFDGSDCSRAALRAGLDVAKAFGDRLVVVYAYAPPERLVGEEYKAHREALREEGERVTTEAKAAATTAEVEAEILLVPNRPLEAILGVSGERDARLIVVGTYGEGLFKSAIVGSVPHKLLQLSDRPVLVVPIGPGES